MIAALSDDTSETLLHDESQTRLIDLHTDSSDPNVWHRFDCFIPNNLTYLCFPAEKLI